MAEDKSLIPHNTEYKQLVSSISSLIDNARNQIAREVNTAMVDTYWHIGQYIVEFEQGGEARAAYGQGLMKQLSHDLTLQFGKGFGISNLKYIRKFYLTFPKGGTMSHFLSWGHYYEILKIDDEMERTFYMRQCEQEKWNVRELKRQMQSMLFHRIALSKEPSEVLALANEGQHIQEPKDLLHDPYVLEFVDLPSPYLESDLENELVEKFADFCCAMFSDLTKKITMQNLYHDGGFSSIGMNERAMNQYNLSFQHVHVDPKGHEA